MPRDDTAGMQPIDIDSAGSTSRTPRKKGGRPEWLLDRMRQGNEFDKLVAEFYLYGGSGLKAQVTLNKDPEFGRKKNRKGRVDLIAQFERGA